ncbi:phosphotransferase-like protein [Streptomyces sp. NPDC004830]
MSAGFRRPARIVVDGVLLGGPVSQEGRRRALAGLDGPWVGVRCDGEVDAGRENRPGDRTGGLAAAQAQLVHEGVMSDMEVDTVRAEFLACARVVAVLIT